MRIAVEHVTRYRYDRPVRGVVQSHRLTPARFDGQKVLTWNVMLPGGEAGGAFRDGSGDWVQAWTVKGPVTEIEVRVEGQVETFDVAGMLKGHRESTPPDVWLRDTETTRADAAMHRLVESARHEDPLSFAHAMAFAVAGAVEYVPGATDAGTTAAQALAKGKGVCQDHAHILITCARVAGFPARYVSGYLFATGDVAAHEAAHAWAELHVPGYGWIGFDPANRCCPDTRYIRLGAGLDAKEAAPIKGVARGTGSESLEISVAVHCPVAQQSQSQ